MRSVESVNYRNLLFNLQLARERHDEAIAQTTSGKKLTKFSDGPADMAYVLNLRGKLQQIGQFDKNIQTGLSLTSAAETALDASQKLMYRVVTLAEQGASETSTAEGRAIIAGEIEEIRKSLINYANTETMDRFVFAGSLTETQPFTEVAGVVNYNGNYETMNIQADFSVRVGINIPGNQVFSGPVDVFDRLADLRDALLANDTAGIGATISGMNQVINQLSQAIGILGDRQSHLQQVKGMLKDFGNAITAKISSLEDADMAKAITTLANEEVALQATLQAGARINRQNLFNYLG